MIKITDMTLSCLDEYNPSPELLRLLYEYLLSLGADVVEMSESTYEKLRPLSSDKYMLRIGSPDGAALYPEVSRFVCRRSGMPPTPAILSEIQINDIKEINFLERFGTLENVRIVGLDDVLCHDYENAFSSIKRQLRGRIQFCPENSLYCATASAVEWILHGGTDIVTTFGGISGKASLEEVLIALRVVKRYKPSASFSILPQIAGLIEEITSIRFSDRKAVIGRRIFDVESGIHVDGILKKPQMYEPYLPELVGRSRKIVIGKHSGRKAVSAKLSELGLFPDEYDIPKILSEVRKVSVNKMSGLTDGEFLFITKALGK